MISKIGILVILINPNPNPNHNPNPNPNPYPKPNPKPNPNPNPKPNPPKVVREAEQKLKEMSRKAKERKTAQNTSKQKGLSEVNYFWIVIGGLGALGVGYLVFGRKEPERRPRQRPVAYVPPPPAPKTPEKVSEEIGRDRVATPKFELNCF